jgi:hypothetical protein
MIGLSVRFFPFSETTPCSALAPSDFFTVASNLVSGAAHSHL